MLFQIAPFAVALILTVLTFTLLVAPGAAALCFVRGLRDAFIFATAVGVIATVARVFASYLLDFPTGPTIVAIFALSYGYAAPAPPDYTGKMCLAWQKDARGSAQQGARLDDAD